MAEWDTFCQPRGISLRRLRALKITWPPFHWTWRSPPQHTDWNWIPSLVLLLCLFVRQKLLGSPKDTLWALSEIKFHSWCLFPRLVNASAGRGLFLSNWEERLFPFVGDQWCQLRYVSAIRRTLPVIPHRSHHSQQRAFTSRPFLFSSTPHLLKTVFNASSSYNYLLFLSKDIKF